jgi:DNA-binding beta-propeller fold protein YncE
MNRIAIAATLLALGSASASSAGPMPCGKNHYILDEPCAMAATEVAIGAPTGLAISAAGELHFSSQSIVFRVDAGGMLDRVAGTGIDGFGGDGGPAAQALLNFPVLYPELALDRMLYDMSGYREFAVGLAFDASGNLYIADSYNNRIRRVDARDGTIGTYIGGAREADDFWWPQGLAFDADGRLYVTGHDGWLLRIAAGEGPVDRIATWPDVQLPQGLAMGADDNLLVAGSCAVKKVSPQGAISVAVASKRCSGWYDPKSVSLSEPHGVAVDAEGNLFIADTYNNCIRRKAAAGGIETIAGTCSSLTYGFWGDGGPAAEGFLNMPKGVAVDGAGNIFIADTGNNRVRRIDRDGIITTFAGNGKPLQP